MEKHFLDLPVYRICEESYLAELDRKFFKEPRERWLLIAGKPQPRESEEFYQNHIYEKYGPWQFNEIVGYIRLYFRGSQILGAYFSAEKKRTLLTRKKTFTYRTHKLAYEQQIWPTDQNDNRKIWEEIQSYVERCKRELKKGRVIDTSQLETIGPHVDWVALLRSE